MNRSNLVIASLFACLFATTVECGDNTPGTLPDLETFQIFLLAGQSNMAGRGDITPGDLEVHPQVLMLTKDGNWQYAVDPVHYDKKLEWEGWVVFSKENGLLNADHPIVTVVTFIH